jgi:hypothetical protein
LPGKIHTGSKSGLQICAARKGGEASRELMEPISTILFKIYRGTPQHSDWMVACLQGVWPSLLGERLAQVCRPASFSGSTLVIEVLDSDWAGALRSTRKQLLEKLRNATADEVLRLEFR